MNVKLETTIAKTMGFNSFNIFEENNRSNPHKYYEHLFTKYGIDSIEIDIAENENYIKIEDLENEQLYFIEGKTLDDLKERILNKILSPSTLIMASETTHRYTDPSVFMDANVYSVTYRMNINSVFKGLIGKSDIKKYLSSHNDNYLFDDYDISENINYDENDEDYENDY